jgi:hypothetical protein
MSSSTNSVLGSKFSDYVHYIKLYRTIMYNKMHHITCLRFLIRHIASILSSQESAVGPLYEVQAFSSHMSYFLNFENSVFVSDTVSKILHVLLMSRSMFHQSVGQRRNVK